MKKKPIVLCILDGWGYRDGGADNAIHLAYTPTFDHLRKTAPFCLLEASGVHVGLPPHQMGNSEVGHLHISAGRVIEQNLLYLSKRLNTLHTHPPFLQFIKKLQHTKRQCHVIGLLSLGGVHSHVTHIIQILKALNAHRITTIVHGFTDGRDSPPQGAYEEISSFLSALKDLPYVKLGTLMGRYWSMDRDQRWERTQKAFNALVFGGGKQIKHFLPAISNQYTQGITDEFLEPMVHESFGGVKKDDALFITHFRSDRIRQLIDVFCDPRFSVFARPDFLPLEGLGTVAYGRQFMPALFPRSYVAQTLGEIVSAYRKTQLRLAETEKYAHVTFFFNGGEEKCFAGEDRILIPSPQVATYDQHPQMSALDITHALCEAIKQQQYDMIVVNYANADMVGHTGNLHATIESIECIDQCLKTFLHVLYTAGGEALITADHGNAEVMQRKNISHHAHTSNPVPCLFVSQEKEKKFTRKQGTLCDIAPTMLSLLNIPAPDRMRGTNLLRSVQ